VILCGGAGTRLWPLSRRDRPKQLLPLASERTLLHDTLERCAGLGEPLLIGAASQRFLLSEASRRAGHAPLLIAEPAPRNTCAAAVAAALVVAAQQPDALVLLLPADHRVGDPGAFREAVAAGEEAARAGRIVVFGITADRPHTGYGWIEPAAGEGCRPVRRFVEKPDAVTAERLLATGHLWNAGIFLFRPAVLLAEVERFAPEILHAARGAVTGAIRQGRTIALDPAPWSASPSVPIDVAVMERTTLASVVPVDMDWSDLGSYAALHATRPPDPHGTVAVGDAVGVDTVNCYLHGEDLLVTAVGVRDLVVVGTPDAVLVAPRDGDDRVKALVQRLGDRPEVTAHPRAERPWGRYRVLDQGDGFQVKRIVVTPGERLSLQRHRHRDEHWIVVAGQGRVALDDAERPVSVGDHVHVARGAAHRLTNAGPDDLVLVEVQLGAYLGEDDIERLDDQYGRGDAD
jgi:mannose-1-phosphate guanylyltransferase/mannose-6-phosphate isomerase